MFLHSHIAEAMPDKPAYIIQLLSQIYFINRVVLTYRVLSHIDLLMFL